MKTSNITVLNLIDDYNKTNNKKILESIIKKVIFETLDEKTCAKLLEIQQISLQKLVILNAPIEFLHKFLVICEDEELISVITSRFINENIRIDADSVINAKFPKLRKYAFNKVSKGELIKRALVETDEENVNTILIIFQQVIHDDMRNEDFENLINAKDDKIASYACYNVSKSKFIEAIKNNIDLLKIGGIYLRLLTFEFSNKEADSLLDYFYNIKYKEDYKMFFERTIKHIINYVSEDKIIKFLLMEDNIYYNYNIFSEIRKRILYEEDIVEIANKLANSPYSEVRYNFANYISRDKIIERLKKEEIPYIFNILIKRINECNLSTEEANELVEKLPVEYSKYLIEYVSRSKKIEILSKLSDCDRKIQLLMDTLAPLSFKEADELLMANPYQVRVFAIEYASNQKIIERLCVEDDFYVRNCMLEILGESDYIPNLEELEQLFSSGICKYACKFFSLDKVIELAENEKDIEKLNIFAQFIKVNKLTQMQANKLLDSELEDIRAHAYKYASLNLLVKRLEIENDEALINVIISRLKKYNFSEEEANRVARSEKNIVKKFICEYVSKDVLLEILLNENNVSLIEKCLRRIEKIGLSKEEADKLLNAVSLLTRRYVIKYASKDKIIERLVVETDNEFIIKAMQYLVMDM